MSEILGPAPQAVERGVDAAPLSAERPNSRGWYRFRGHLDQDSWPDLLLGSLLTLATFVTHDVRYVLTAPYWNDEAWVAISTKLPLHQLAQVASSTPVGWDLLLRSISWGQDPPLRIVPLLFAAFTVTAAFGYVRSLPWPGGVASARMAAVLAGTAALVLPSALIRNDLKQYTADAFVTLVILWMVTRLEERWTRRRVLGLAVAVVVGFLFSAVSAFVGAAAFGSVLLVRIVRRRWVNAVEALVAGGSSGVVLLVTFVVLYRPGLPAGLNDYWAAFYIPVSGGWAASWKFIHGRSVQEALYLGMGPLLLAVLLVVAGVVTLVRLRRYSVALLVPALVVEMLLLAALKQYPLFDPRTSHFITTAFAVTAAIGVAGLCSLPARLHPSIAFVTAAVVTVVFVSSAPVRGDLRAHSIPAEDLRTPTRYIAAHRQRGDIIVVATLSSWGFAYYWTGAPDGGGTPATEDVTINLQGFVTVFPDQPNIFVALDRTRPAVDKVMGDAAAAAARAGASARIWVIHVHNTGGELRAYSAAAQANGFTDRPVIPPSLDLLTRAGAAG